MSEILVTPNLHRSCVLRLIVAVVAGGAIGGLTEWSVLHLGRTLLPLSNTAAPWVLGAFVMALTARRTWESLLLGFVTLVALVAGFYVAQATRGWEVDRHQVIFWTASSFVAGPLVGAAAGCLRYAGVTAGACGAGIVGGIFVGEAVHGLRDVSESTVAGYWEVELAVGLVLAVSLTLWRCRERRADALGALLVSLSTCAVVGLGTLVAYQVT